MKSEKLLKMIYLLLENEKLSAQILAEKLEVSVRTIFRYVDSLTEAGFPVYVLKGRNGGIAMLPQFKLNSALVNKEEQRDILASLQSLQALNIADGTTLKKLSTLFQQDPISWLQIDPTDWNQVNDQQNSLAVLRSSILQKRLVKFNYINSKNEYRKRLVFPYQVLFKDRAWYLQGYSIERKGARIFKLARMDQLKLVENDPKTIDQSEPWKDVELTPTQLNEKISVELLFDTSLKYRIYEEFNHQDIVEQSDGSYLVKCTMFDSEWLTTYLLSFGSHLKIKSPMFLKKRIRQELEKMLENY